MPNIGPMELIIVLVIVLLIFGAKRLPELGRSLGSGMKEFKDSVSSKDKDDDDDRVTATAALPRAEDAEAPITGETVRESTPR